MVTAAGAREAAARPAPCPAPEARDARPLVPRPGRARTAQGRWGCERGCGLGPRAGQGWGGEPPPESGALGSSPAWPGHGSRDAPSLFLRVGVGGACCGMRLGWLGKPRAGETSGLPRLGI